MKSQTTRTILRTFLRLQILCMCVLLVGTGAAIAASRTEMTAHGVPAAVQTDKPAAGRIPLPDRETLEGLWEYAGMLPAPVGNMVSLYNSIRNIDADELSELFGSMHKNFL